MGGLYGAWLHKAGYRVTLVDVSQAAVDAINANGLGLEKFDGTMEKVEIPATTNPASVGPVDLVIVQVKGRNTRAAAESARPLMAPHTTVLTLQNGWGNAQCLQEILGRDQVAAGISLHSGGLIAPGHVKHSGLGYTTIGELGGGTTPRIQAVADVLAATGKVNISGNIVTEIWTKLALNCSCLAACSMLRFRSGLMLELANATALMKATTLEVVTVAQAAGIPLDYETTWAHIEDVVGRAKHVRCSMLQDVENGRLTEIDTINGAVVNTAAGLGVPVPINQTLVWLIRAHDESVLKGSRPSA
jgi:2-dehydropantoate 2-reductase